MRRGGPPDEPPWWEPVDQRLAERVGPPRSGLPKLWKPTVVANNAEVFDPCAGIAAATDIAAARERRRRTALVEGDAWRGPRRQLVVLRVEAFADDDTDGRAHRDAWQRDGRAVLDEVWRQRWSERDVTPGWIDVRTRADVEVVSDVDWLRVEDHTRLANPEDVAVYQHLTVWAGRGVAVVTLRHLLDTEADEVAGWFATAVLSRLRWAFDAGSSEAARD